MKRSVLDKMFTEYVNGYLNQGWIINVPSMAGHQGEEAKVDLVHGDQLVRIWMEKVSSNWMSEDWHGSSMIIRIGTWKYPASEARSSWSTVWMKDFEIFVERKYYEISTDWYVETLEEAMDYQKKHYANYSKHSRSYEYALCSAEAVEIAVKYLKRKYGYKRVSREKIIIKKNLSRDLHHAAYYVSYNGNVHRVK